MTFSLSQYLSFVLDLNVIYSFKCVALFFLKASAYFLCL